MSFSINREIFNHINSSPQYLSDGDLTFIYRFCNDNYIGFILPRRLGDAHKRNRFKRRCRSVFQSMNRRATARGLGLIIKTRRIDVPYNNINNTFKKLNKVVSL